MSQEAIGVYIHWPYCRSKCPYCDFNSHPIDAGIGEDIWLKALLAELDRSLIETDPAPIATVFFGGGTPSLMGAKSVGAILDRLGKARPQAANLEVTLEANPTASEKRRFQGFRSAGVTRLSLGIQSLDDQALKFLGRRHTAKAALEALDRARSLFDRVSADFIYALPNQSPAAWESQLQQIAGLGLDHLSLYQLTLEPGTPLFSDMEQNRFQPLDADPAAGLYEITQQVLEGVGLPAYEISNHARPGFECRHNLDVWRGAAYIGLGPGAHGREYRQGRLYASERIADPALWREEVARHGQGLAQLEPVLPGERAQELILMGLRLTGGIDRALFARRSGFALEEVVDAQALVRLEADGFLEADARSVRATPKGRLVLNALLAALLAGR